MHMKKPVYLLAGGRKGPGTTDLLLKAVFRESGKPHPTIAYIGAANNDNLAFYGLMAGMLRSNGAGRINRILLASAKADPAQARKILETADIVFMAGGDVEKGMQIINDKRIGDLLSDLYESGKVFFGSSAGSIILARKWICWRDPADDTTAELFPCLGLAPVICDTHGEEEWEELQALLKLEDDGATGYGIVSGTAIRVWPDSTVEAMGDPVHRYQKQSGLVARIADILPVT